MKRQKGGEFEGKRLVQGLNAQEGGRKKVGGRQREGRSSGKVPARWRVAAAKGLVPRRSEDSHGPTQRAIRAVGEKALETRRCSVRVRMCLALCKTVCCTRHNTVPIKQQNQRKCACHLDPPSHTHVFRQGQQTHRHVALSATLVCWSGLPQWLFLCLGFAQLWAELAWLGRKGDFALVNACLPNSHASKHESIASCKDPQHSRLH